MKIHNKYYTLRRVSVMMLFFLMIAIGTKSQVNYSAASIKIKVEGSSNIHDWHMEAEQANSNAVFNLNGNVIAGIPNLAFSMQAESLKSESKVMDKNTYKAMVTDKYPVISFNANTTNIRPNGANSFIASVKGKMQISSVSKEIWLTGTCTVNPDKSITVSGIYKFKMTEYNVTPPSIMFGSIVVTDDLLIRFNILYKPQ